MNPETTSICMGRHRHLLALSLIAGFLLVAESLAIHQSPIHTSSSYINNGRCGRTRRSPSWRLGNHDNLHESSSTLLMASSGSDTAETSIEEELINAVNIDDDKTIENVSGTRSKQTVQSAGGADETEVLSIWPKFDELDKRMIKIALPCIANFAINPLIGAVDLFWVNRMGNALAVAGQAAANQVFSSAFWIVSVLPSGMCCVWHDLDSFMQPCLFRVGTYGLYYFIILCYLVTATLVSKANASGNQEEIQDAVSQALIVGFYISLVGSKCHWSLKWFILSCLLEFCSIYSHPLIQYILMSPMNIYSCINVAIS